MKRFSQSLTAVAMASALALGGATVAQADESTTTTRATDMPAPETDSTDATNIPNPGGDTAEDTADDTDIPAPATKQDDEGNTWYQSTQDATVYVKDPNKVNEPITDQMRADYNKAFGVPTEEGIPAPATKKDKFGNTCYQHLQDPTVYVKDPNKVNEPITDEMRAECQDFDKKQLAWLALPAALIIGGIVWHLANDGKTYVKDENSKEAPSAEEKAASDKMLQENKDEVIAQGGKLAGQDAGAANTDRGMLAQTGSNTAARGLAALAVLAMIAAGAFAVRRKIFA